MTNPIKLNQLRPLLKECSILEGERNLVIEDRGSKAQVVLPKESRSILELLDGENSIQDISATLYQSQGQVSFQSIITTLKLLNEAHLLEGMVDEFSEMREEKSPHEQKASILSRSLFELNLLNRVRINFSNDWAFFGLALLVVSMLAFNYEAFTHLNLARFLKSPTGYHEALLRVFFVSSILMSVKALLQGLLLLLSTGTVYRPSLRFFPYGISLGINDNSLYSHTKKSVIISYGVISSLLYLAVYAGIELIPEVRPYRSDFAVLAVLLTFIELNPYRRSDLTKLFFFFYAEAQLKNIMPYLKNCTLAGLWKDTGTKLSDEVRYITYSILAFSWAITFSIFSFEVVLKSFPSLFYQIQLGDDLSKYSAMAVMGTLLFITGYLMVDLFHTIVRNVLSPALLPLMRLRREAREYDSLDFSLDEIRDNFKKNMLFNQFTDGAIDFLLNNSTTRTIKKGDHLIIQGDSSRDVFFLIRGSVDVTVKEKTGRNKHIATLGANTVIGEMAILQECKRSANVTAAEDIVYIEFPQGVFAKLAEAQFKHDFEKLRSRIEISQFVASANLFRDFPPEVMNLFVEAGDLVLFPGGHNVVDEGEQDKTFYLLIKGKVDIFKAQEKVAELSQGDFFGEVALIANVPRTATVKTVEDSLFLYIEDKKFWNILSENIELAMYIESVGRLRMAEAA